MRSTAQIAAVAIVCLSGCTSMQDYVHNGFKVGPNYSSPGAEVARNWIDADDVRVRKDSDDLSKWWMVFNDPALDSLVRFAYRQNLSLRVAGYRVLEARAQTAIEVGELFPQTQTMTGGFTRNASSRSVANPLSSGAKRWYDQWNDGFNLSWELDFWGRLRRAIESDAATLDASVENYDDVLVTLLGDVATNYVTYRTTQRRIDYAQENAALQRKTLQIVEGQLKVGVVGELDVDQARSTLEQTEAGIPELEIALRRAANQLCILLGIPPQDLQARLGSGAIPTAPPEVAVGIPADLLRRRPDVRRAERQAAAQSAQIGIAEAEFYPHIAINGTIGYSAQNFRDLFNDQALSGNVGPSFTWNILNYGRLANNVRLQQARFQELVTTYRNTVLNADQDVENGLVTFLRAQQRAKSQGASATDAKKAVDIVLAQYSQGVIDLTRVTLLQQNLVGLEDTLAQSQGEIATGLIQVYRALGGGWEIRLAQGDSSLPPPPGILAPPPTMEK
jgi:NodT family efflux transporter outer membrane factor (OMF) lipoprotein